MKEVNVTSSTMLCSINVFNPVSGREYKAKWIRENPLFLGDTELGERIVTPVAIVGDPSGKQHWMDVITGSLYTKDGRCLTSTNIHLTNVRKAEGLEARLRAINPFDKKRVKVTGIGDKK